MPVVSKAQQGWLAVHRPDLLHKWAHKYGISKNLPYHKSKGVKKRGGKSKGMKT